jgi:hypothetical protein
VVYLPRFSMSKMGSPPRRENFSIEKQCEGMEEPEKQSCSRQGILEAGWRCGWREAQEP